MVLFSNKATVALFVSYAALAVKQSHDPVLEREKLLVAAYEVYLAQNISYDCFQYAERNSVAECDCSACLEAQPDFVTRMCTFRRARARVYADAIDRTKVQAKNWMWRAICNPRCRFRLPSTCCDPVGSKLPMQAGCPTCLPTDNSIFSADLRGHHVSCLFETTHKTQSFSESNWFQRYLVVLGLMDQAKLSDKCMQYALLGKAAPCNCRSCLGSEATSRALREKLCEYGRLVRAKKELHRPSFWADSHYLLKFCDFYTCPEIPHECCSLYRSKEVDRNGCPVCLPTSIVSEFGPRCSVWVTGLPEKMLDRLIARFEV
ncbi:uncharacterized protein LOC111265020 [Varroa jacobsoni]|uniref:Uncharacterized protein n=1 Tax=Varroa destructor TaxID=109461 RepID=A0A7M7JGF8_VARDE|nr:uncharacterized protein LOC111243920 [Varroa destructor]XP_022697086.1 uncharacterized protein LOC111265020 [Varroa jacobsoni]XP_022697087.1 uncharacterized protein LOC111265020 [Varroa jacobsoni]